MPPGVSIWETVSGGAEGGGRLGELLTLTMSLPGVMATRYDVLRRNMGKRSDP